MQLPNLRKLAVGNKITQNQCWVKEVPGTKPKLTGKNKNKYKKRTR
jgi:hypothetical protein